MFCTRRHVNYREFLSAVRLQCTCTAINNHYFWKKNRLQEPQTINRFLGSLCEIYGRNNPSRLTVVHFTVHIPLRNCHITSGMFLILVCNILPHEQDRVLREGRVLMAHKLEYITIVFLLWLMTRGHKRNPCVLVRFWKGGVGQVSIP